MRTRNSLVFNLAIVAVAAALFAIPGEAKQPAATVAKSPQATFGVFLDPHAAPVLTIEPITAFRSA